MTIQNTLVTILFLRGVRVLSDVVRNRRGLTACCLLLLGWSLASAQNYVFGPNVRVNTDEPGRNWHGTWAPGEHLIAARGDTVYLVWRDDRGAHSHIYFRRSNDGGLTFLPEVQVDRSYAGIIPSLKVDARGVVHVCWLNYGADQGQRYVYYANSTDGGTTFNLPVRACDSIDGDQYAWPSMSVSRDGRDVYVIRDEGYRIRLARSTDGGTSFVTPNTVVQSDTTLMMGYPAIAVFQDTIVFAAWNDMYLTLKSNVYFSRSTDGGRTFGAMFLLNDSVGNVDFHNQPSLGADSLGRVFVVFPNFSPPRYPLGFTVSHDTGRTFDPARGILNFGLYPSLHASPGGQLFLGWQTSVRGWDHVRFAFSPDGGETFMGPVNPADVTLDSITQKCVTVVANENDRVFAAWEDRRNDIGGFNNDIYFAAGQMSGIEERIQPFHSDLQFCTVSSPTRGLVKIDFGVAMKTNVRVNVADECGRVMAVLQDGMEVQGQHNLVWDGRDAAGEPVGAGIFFVSIRTSSETARRKLILLK